MIEPYYIGEVRVFIAGASGVIGIRLVPLLVHDGHVVTAMTRTESKVDLLRSLGAIPVLCDVYDTEALNAAVALAQPETIVHLLTDLPDDPGLIKDHAASNNRIRREGTRNLLLAAKATQVRRIVAQSVAWDLGGNGTSAIQVLEDEVLRAEGIIIRYGRLYGPGTYYEHDLPEPPRIHVENAALRTASLIDATSGVLLVADE